MTDEMSAKRLLIVDDEPQVASILADSLARVSDDYLIETAASGAEALAKAQEHTYALVLTDYKMPGMNGLELAETIHQMSPTTQVVLMTAYGSGQLIEWIEQLDLAGYLDKPFSISQVREVIERALLHTAHETPAHPPIQGLGQPVAEQLSQLQADTKARCVLLLNAEGYAVDTAGQTDNLDIPSLSALIAANFMAVTELARMLGNRSIFKSSYHEGPDYNIYAYDVNGELLLAVIFGLESKVGAVWLYAKQTAAALVSLVEELSTAIPIEEGLAEAVSAEMDRLFDIDGGDGPGGALLDIEEAIATGLLPAGLWGQGKNDH